MTCGGCSGAVSKALARHPDITNVNISLETQLVKLTTTKTQQEVFDIIKKTGKPVENA